MDVKLPDGRILKNVPEGTTKAQIAEKLGLSDVSTPQASPDVRQKPTTGQRADAAWEGIKQGSTAGFADEAQAAIAGLYAGIASPNLTVPQAYEQALSELRQEEKQARETSPATYYPGMLAGTVATGLQGAKYAPQAAVQFSAAKPLTSAAATGGISGAIYGFGSGEGGGAERLKSAGVGGGAGMLAGPAGAYIGSKVNPLARGLKDKAISLFTKKAPAQPLIPMQEIISRADDALPATATYQQLTSEAKAMDKVVNAIKQDFPDNYEQVLKSWRESGEPLAKLYGSRTTTLAKGAAQYPSGAAKSQEYFSKEIAESPERLKSAINKNISGVEAYYTTADDLIKAGKKAAAPKYEKAFSVKNISDERINQFLQQPELQSGIQRGLKIQRLESLAEGKPFNPSDYAITGFNEAGDPIIDAVPNMRLLDAGKRGLDAMIQEQTDSVTGRVTDLGRALLQVKKSYVNEMRRVNPYYDDALKSAGDYFDVDNAIRGGKDFMKLDPEVLEKTVSGMTKPEKDAFKIGVGKQIRDIIDKAPEGRNPYNAIFGSNSQKQRLMKVLSPSEYKNLEMSLKAEDKLFKMRNEVLGGSPTASKAVAAAQIADGAADAAMALSTGNIRSIGISGVRSAVGKMFDGLNDKTSENVARIIYETDPVRKAQIIQKISGSKSLTQAEKAAIKEVYFKAADLIKGRTAGAVATGTGAAELTVPIFLDPERRAMEGKGPEVNLP